MTRDELIKELEVLRTENQRLHEENEALRKEVAVAQEQVATAREVFAQLTARIERLDGQVAKDSHNSSRPPSSDGPKSPVRKTKSLYGTIGSHNRVCLRESVGLWKKVDSRRSGKSKSKWVINSSKRCYFL